MSKPSHVKHLDVSKFTNDAALMALHDAIKARGALPPGSFTSLDPAGRREYFRVRRQEARRREREAAQSGALKATTANIRAALADAALMLLAANGPGADQVRHVLGAVFSQRPGVPVSVEHKARKGKLRPKLVGKA